MLYAEMRAVLLIYFAVTFLVPFVLWLYVRRILRRLDELSSVKKEAVAAAGEAYKAKCAADAALAELRALIARIESPAP